MLTNVDNVEHVETPLDGVNEIRYAAKRAARSCRKNALKMIEVVELHGRASLVAELENGEGVEFLALFAAMKSIAETYLPNTEIAELP